MKETVSLIKEAYRSYRRRRHEDSIVLLKKVVSTVRDNPYPEFLLAVQYLLTDRFDRVQPILRRMHYSSPDYLPFIQLELFIFLKAAGDRESALSMYLDALQRFPADPFIRRGVKQLRENTDFQSYQKKAPLRELVHVPAPGRFSMSKGRNAGKSGISKSAPGRRRIVLITLCVLTLTGTGIMIGLKYYYSTAKNADGRTAPAGEITDIDMIVLDKSRYGLVEKITRQREPVFYYSSDEVLKDFNEARAQLKQEKHNEALMLINKLLHSNATPGVKERAGFLKRFILDNDDRSVSGVSFKELSRNPYLYEGILVSWTGRVANLKRKQGRLMFNLMVEYREHDVFTGVADVYAEKEFTGIDNGDILTVQARYIASQGKDGRAYLLLREATKK